MSTWLSWERVWADGYNMGIMGVDRGSCGSGCAGGGSGGPGQ